MTREERNQYYKDWKRQLHQAKMCVTCKRVDAYTMAGHWNCYECSQKSCMRMKKRRQEEGYAEQRQQKRLELENKRRESGLCFRCGKPLTDTRYKTCGRCRAKIAKYKRTQYGDVNYPRGANGICWLCNKKNVLEGHKVCEACYKTLTESVEYARGLCDRTDHVWKADETARRTRWQGNVKGDDGFKIWDKNLNM